MNCPEITIKHYLHELNMKKEQELDIYLENGMYIKIAISDKGTPVILSTEKDKLVINDWKGQRGYRQTMNDLWDKEHEDDDLDA